MAETSYAFVDSIGDMFPDQVRDFILAGYDPLAVVAATAAPYGPGPGGGGTDPAGPGPGGGGTYLSVMLESGLQPDGSPFSHCTVKNVGTTIVPGFALQWAITTQAPD